MSAVSLLCIVCCSHGMLAGPRSESLLLGNRELPARQDRHNVFIKWNKKYGNVLRRRFADTHVSASLAYAGVWPLPVHEIPRLSGLIQQGIVTCNAANIYLCACAHTLPCDGSSA